MLLGNTIDAKTWIRMILIWKYDYMKGLELNTTRCELGRNVSLEEQESFTPT